MALANPICALQQILYMSAQCQTKGNQYAEGHAAWAPSAECPLARAETDRPSCLGLWRQNPPHITAL